VQNNETATPFCSLPGERAKPQWHCLGFGGFGVLRSSVGMILFCLALSCSNQFAFANPPSNDAQERNNANQALVECDKQSLSRLDFRIKGRSCAVCLIGIQNRLKRTPGIIKAAVMLKAPYGASIIYNAKVISEKAILKIVTNGDQSISLLDPKVIRLTKLPVVLMPPLN
jgi:hypothetical protein